MISAILVNYYSARAVVRAVHSLLPPRQQDTIDIWVVDNSNSEEEADLLQTHLGGTCHLIINSENVGFAAACNQAYDAAQGELILLLNPDAYFEPGAVQAMRAFLDAHPDTGAVGPLIYWDRGRHFLLPPSPIPSPWSELLAVPKNPVLACLAWLSSLHWRDRSRKVWRTNSPVRQSNLSGGHSLLRRTAVEKAGGLFDPRFFLYYEDSDLCLRMRHAGYSLFVVPKAVVVHEFGGCARHKEQWKREEMAKSHRLFMEKHYASHIAFWLAKGLRGRPGFQAQIPRITDLGVVHSPPVFSVPGQWREGWLLEWSPNPSLLPAAGFFGKGEQAAFPQEAWEVLPPGKQFTRLGSSRRFWTRLHVWQWEKE